MLNRSERKHKVAAHLNPSQREGLIVRLLWGVQTSGSTKTGSGTGSGEGPRSSRVLPEWARLHVWQVQPVRDVLLFALLLGVVWLGYRLSLVTIPVLLALLLAYLFEPLIAWLTRDRRMRRPFAVLMLILVSALVIVVPTVLGLTFGVAQASNFTRAQIGNVERLLKSVDKPDELPLRDALPSERWRSLRDWLVEQEAKAALLSAVDGAKRGAGRGDTEPDGKDAGEQSKKLQNTKTSGSKVFDSKDVNDTGKAAESVKKLAIEPFVKEELTKPEEVPAATSADESSADSSDEEQSGRDITVEVLPGTDQKVADVVQSESAPFEFVSNSVAQATTGAIAWLRENAAGLGAKAVQAGAGALGTVGRVAGSIAAILFTAFLTMFFFYFFSVSWDSVLAYFKDFVPENRRERVFSLVNRMDRVIAGFVRGRLTICVCQMVFFTLAYWLIGVPAPLIVGPIVGLLTLVPYGAALGMPVAMLLMALDPSISSGIRGTWWWIIAMPILAQGISQVMDDYFLTPKIQGKNTDMSMPMILFASIAGGVLAGVYGLLIAIPVAACAKILFLEVVMPRIKAWAAGKAEDFLPIER